jgi:hypothetical protein
MEQISGSPRESLGSVPHPERHPIQILLRAYAEAKPTKKKDWQPRKPSKWVLVFDTETTDDEKQRLRFGSFQLREGERLELHGLFYDPDPDATSEVEQIILAREAKRLKCKLFPIDEFIEKVFIPAAYRNGATIVGFNLPFDLSRIAIGVQPARPVRRIYCLRRDDRRGLALRFANRPYH